MVVGTDGAAHRKTVDARHPGWRRRADHQRPRPPTDMVITSGAYGLDEGAKVKVGPAEEDEAKPAAGKGGDKD